MYMFEQLLPLGRGRVLQRAQLGVIIIIIIIIIVTVVVIIIVIIIMITVVKIIIVIITVVIRNRLTNRIAKADRPDSKSTVIGSAPRGRV